MENSANKTDFITENPKVNFWPSTDPLQWSDWKWQMKNRIITLAQVEKHLILSEDERIGILFSENKLSLGITPYYFNLIDPVDPLCPIRKQVIPLSQEGSFDPWEMLDPCGEDNFMPVPGLVHRYPDRVLLLVTDRCAAYCRYCTRSRIVSGAGEQEFTQDIDAAINYLERNQQIRDVLISGGDPLLFSDEKLDHLLLKIRSIPHIEFLRIGSRVPIFLPQRITPSLCEMLKKYHPLWMSIHANHPKEISQEVQSALNLLANHGIPLGNQSVLLSGVNDSLPIMKALVHKLLQCRVRPYYLYQCDLIKGSSHLRTSVRKGLEIIEGLRGFTSGYAVPQFVIDAPGGGGKVCINPNYVIFHDQEKIVFRNFEGKIFEYPELADK